MKKLFGQNTRPGGGTTSSRLIIGRNTVRQALLRDPERFIKIFFAKGERESSGARVEFEKELQTARHIDVEEIPAKKLSELANSESHQGVAALLQQSPDLSVKELVSFGEGAALLLLLDGISDPQNLGALLRAAECFQADGVVVSTKHGASITPVATKASVGASELLRISEVSNLANALRPIRDAGIWIVAADCDDTAEPLEQFEFPDRSAILLGSEGRGLQPLLKKEADFRVKIPVFGAIDSLNVSQACAIFLHSYRTRYPVEGR